MMYMTFLWDLIKDRSEMKDYILAKRKVKVYLGF